MKKRLLLAIAVLLIGVQGRSHSAADLELRFSSIGVNGEVPQGFSFELVNVSDHEVRLAAPQVECTDAFSGYILLNLTLKPSDGRWVPGRGCALDSGGPWPSILERARSWKVLRPGEAMTMKRFRNTLLFDDSRAGTYDFWAEYVPPAVSPVDASLLRGSGIEFCEQRLRTKRLRFVGKPR